MSNVVSDAGSDAPLSMDDAVRSYANIGREEVREDETEQHEQDEDQSEGTETGAEEPDEPDYEEQAEDDDQSSDDPVDDARKVRLSDGTVTTVGELKKGTLLHSDYTRKTQEVAQQRREIQERQAQFQQHQQQLQENREFVMRALQATMPPPPDANMLNTDPVGYMQADRLFRERQAQLGNLHQQSLAARQQQEQEADRIRTERQSQETELLLERMPDLRDQRKLEEFQTDIKRFANHWGFEPQQFGLIEDHRTMAMVRDAIAYRKLQASKTNTAQKVQGRPPVQRSGKRPDPGNQAARTKDAAFAKLNRSGSIKDAVAAYVASEG